MHPCIKKTAAIILLAAFPSSAQKFDPYQLNGGLVAAVAGKDYVLLASDTRLTDGGYGINSRRYMSGRIWSASSFPSSLKSSDGRANDDMTSQPPFDMMTAKWEPDGSLAMPSKSSVVGAAFSYIDAEVNTESPHLINYAPSYMEQQQLPVLIGSAGCASDCESLKRRLRLELSALECNSSSRTIGVQSIANLLQQVLYGRRSFPFYSFCVVAGIDDRDSDEEGAVYVYDAIGSFERVAVGCSGTGRELLQPILDRLFSDSTSEINKKQIKGVNSEGNQQDAYSIPAVEQRCGVAGSLRPPVRTTVTCSWKDAVQNVARGYQAVAEREISVGDELVICLMRSRGKNNEPSVDVINFKLKKH